MFFKFNSLMFSCCFFTALMFTVSLLCFVCVVLSSLLFYCGPYTLCVFCVWSYNLVVSLSLFTSVHWWNVLTIHCPSSFSDTALFEPRLSSKVNQYSARVYKVSIWKQERGVHGAYRCRWVTWQLNYSHGKMSTTFATGYQRASPRTDEFVTHS